MKLTSCLNCKRSSSQDEKNFQLPNRIYGSGRSVVRLARLLGVQEVESSNLSAPTIFLRVLLDQSRGEGEIHVADRHFKSFSLTGHHLDDIETGDLAVGAF